MKIILRIIKLIMLVQIFICSEANAEGTQRLLIPRIEKPILAKNGRIEIPAYCSDISKVWPESGSLINNIYWGGAETILHVIVNGRLKDVTLNEALIVLHIIKIVANPGSVVIQKTMSNVKLVDILSAGFLIGQSKDAPIITRAQFLEQLSFVPSSNMDENISLYLRYQQKLWRVINEIEKSNDAIIKSRMREIAAKYFKDKNLQVSIESNGKIKLFDKGKNLKLLSNFYSFESVELYQLRRLNVEEYEEMEICFNFNPMDSSLISFSISGKLKNIIPVEIEYTSSSKISVTGNFKKETAIAPGITVEGGFAIEVDSEDRAIGIEYPFKKCEIKATGKICYPGGVKIDLEVCGVNVSMKPTSFGFIEY